MLDIGVRPVGGRSEEGEGDSTIAVGARGTAGDLRRVTGEMVRVVER